MRKTLTAAFALALALASGAAAQQVGGVVRDSASSRPIVGAVVQTIDASGQTLARTITNEQGAWRLRLTGREASVRVIRIGFRPATATIPAGATLDIRMHRLPTLLEPVAVRAAARCNRNWNTPETLGLLEQARAGLLNSIVARDSLTASLERLEYERTYGRDTISYQSVRITESRRANGSFGAVRLAASFVDSGFVAENGGDNIYYAPDAETLLDPTFSNAYCFRTIADPTRPQVVGLAFQRPGAGRDRVDINGTLWIDTLARQLRNLEFRYQGLLPAIEDGRPGGRVNFLELPNGMTLIDRWALRLVTGELAVSPAGMRVVPSGGLGASQAGGTVLTIHETGGEVSTITLPDGRTIEAELGRLSIQVLTRGGRPVRDATVLLDYTDYRGVTGEDGRVVINRLLPGPYQIMLHDSTLAMANIGIPMAARFVAERGTSLERTVISKTRREYVYERCERDGIWNNLADADSATAWMIGRVVDPDGKPVPGVEVSATKEKSMTAKSVRTGLDGIFTICTNAFKVRDTIELAIDHRRFTFPPIEVKLDGTVSVVPVIRLRPRDR